MTVRRHRSATAAGDGRAPPARSGPGRGGDTGGGLCHIDVGILDDEEWLQRLGPRPLTLGHEVAGVVAELGEGVTGVRVGAPVGVSPSGSTRPGLARDGGYSSACVADVGDLVPIPPGVGFAQAAAGADAGRAAYRAVMVRGQVTAGHRVGIIGLGGLGQFAARIAVLAGAEVYVAEVKESHWPLARELGAADVAADIRAFADRDLDVVVDFAGFGTTTAAAIEAVRREGRVVQVGMARLEATIPTGTLIFKQATLLGSRSGTTADIAAVYELIASGDRRPRLTDITFDDVPEGLRRLHDGQVADRLVMTRPG
ncbi:zinc-binding dehydrogenase [Blastococcus sp. SYSU DS0533]